MSSLAQTLPIDIWAEEFEPFSYKDEHGQITGMSTELVRSLVADAGVEARNWEIATWARAFKEGRENANTLLYTITRTPEREELFYWVGPIVNRELALYKLKSRKDIQI